MVKEAKVMYREEENMPERGGEIPSRIIQSCRVNYKTRIASHLKFYFFTFNKFRASLGVKSAAEAVPVVYPFQKPTFKPQ